MTIYTLDTEDKESVKEIIRVLVEEDLLRSANLFGARLTGADLYLANLRGTNLNLVELRGANLKGAKITPKQLAQIVIVDE